MKQSALESLPEKPQRRLSLLLAARITPLFSIASIAMALLAYWILANAIQWRHEEAVRCSAIVCAEFLRNRLSNEGPSDRQKAALDEAGKKNAVFLTLKSNGETLVMAGTPFEGAAVSHREIFTDSDGTKVSLEAQTPKQLLDDELARWRHILTGFCVGATLFGCALAIGFASIVNRTARKLMEDAIRIDQTPPTSKTSKITELAAVHEALQGLHASLEHRKSALATFEDAEFSNLAISEENGIRAASWQVSGSIGEPFHLSVGCGGLAGIAPDRAHAAAAAAKLGRQLSLPSGPNQAVLEEVAGACPTLEAVILDGVRNRRWRLRDGRIFSEPWQPIGIVAPADHADAERMSTKLASLKTPTSPVSTVRTLSRSISGPAGIVAVSSQQPGNN